MDIGRQLGTILEDSRTTGSISLWPEAHPTTYLAIALTQLLTGVADFTVRPSDLGAYARVFGNWNNAGELPSALSEAADYHAEHTQDPRRGEEEVFGPPVYDIFPVELHAIARVRERLGLVAISIDHPVMATPFGHRPARITRPRDEILERVLATVAKVIPL
jgi:hypothetical protein